MNKSEQKASKEELLGIWSIYATSGRAPANVTQEELIEIENTPITVGDATSLINAILYKERKLIEQLVDDNGVKDIILRDVLGVTEEDIEKAKAVREEELEAFMEEIKAQYALAQAEIASKADKEATEG